MLTLYMVPLFTDFVLSASIKFTIGWMFVCAVAPVFLINICVIIVSAVQEASYSLRACRYERRLVSAAKARASNPIVTAKRGTMEHKKLVFAARKAAALSRVRLPHKDAIRGEPEPNLKNQGLVIG